MTGSEEISPEDFGYAEGEVAVRCGLEDLLTKPFTKFHHTLLQAHEEGRVVFFCGAGISYPAGLKGFKGLFDEIYRLVGTTRNPIEQDAYSRNQFDATPDLLERRLPGQRFAVRKALTKALQPKCAARGRPTPTLHCFNWHAIVKARYVL